MYVKGAVWCAAKPPSSVRIVPIMVVIYVRINSLKGYIKSAPCAMARAPPYINRPRTLKPQVPKPPSSQMKKKK